MIIILKSNKLLYVNLGKQCFPNYYLKNGKSQILDEITKFFPGCILNPLLLKNNLSENKNENFYCYRRGLRSSKELRLKNITELSACLPVGRFNPARFVFVLIGGIIVLIAFVYCHGTILNLKCKTVTAWVDGSPD